MLISGVDPILNCASGYNYPDLQEVQFTVNNGANWYPITNSLTNLNAIQNTNFLSPFEATGTVPQSGTGYSLSSGTYSMKFRFRNVKVVQNFNYNGNQITWYDITCSSPFYHDPTTYSVTY